MQVALVTSKLQEVKGGNVVDEKGTPKRGMPEHALVHMSTQVWYALNGLNKIEPSRHGPHEAGGRGLTGKQNVLIMAKSANFGTETKSAVLSLHSITQG